jgi:hypothetical protein
MNSMKLADVGVCWCMLADVFELRNEWYKVGGRVRVESEQYEVGGGWRVNPN